MKIKKQSMLYSVLCSIGLGAVGALLFGAILCVGYISWIGAYLIVALAALGYKMFTKRKLELKDYLIIGGVSLVFAVLAFLLGSAISVKVQFAKADLTISLGDALKAMFSPESLGLEISVEDCNMIRAAFMRDGLISFVMLALGMFSVFYYDKKQAEKHSKENAEVIEIEPEQTQQSAEEPVQNAEEFMQTEQNNQAEASEPGNNQPQE